MMGNTSTVLLLSIWAAICFGQETPKLTRPGLSGTWVLDMDRSDFGGSKRALVYDTLTLIVELREPEIKITRVLVKKRKETKHPLTYYTDHRGESNKELDGNQTKSKTRWEDNKLIMRSTSSVLTPGGTINLDSVDAWEITDDGKILIQKTTSRMESAFWHTVTSAGGRSSTTQKIYRKAN